MSLNKHTTQLKETENLLTILDISRLLQVSRGTVNRYIKYGGLKAYKLNSGKRGPVRVFEKDLLRFIKQKSID